MQCSSEVSWGEKMIRQQSIENSHVELRGYSPSRMGRITTAK